MARHDTELSTDTGSETKPAPTEAQPAGLGSPAEVGRFNLQESFGSALLSAAATGGPPSDSTKTLNLQSAYGNGAVSRALIQRKEEGAGSPNSTSLASASPFGTAGVAAPTATGSLIVDDAVETIQPGQMRKSEFLARLRASVDDTAAEVLTGTPWSALASPQIDRAFAQYGAQSSSRLERTIRAQVPEAGAAGNAASLIVSINGRARRALQAAVAGGGAGGTTPGEGAASGATGVLGTLGGAAAGAASAVVGGAAGLFFKECDGGGASGAGQDPEAVQARLGAGHPLDGSVRSRMESAFGQSFSAVEVHTDANADGLSGDLGARAFTVGQHVAFRAGEYRPGTPVGDALIAHELAHVMQQRGGSASGVPAQKGATEYGALEEDADEAAVGAVVSVWGGMKKGLAKVSKKAMPGLKSGLRLQKCDCGSSPTPTVSGVRFSDLRRAWPALNAAERQRALVPAINSARARASLLYQTAGSDPILSVRRRIEGGVSVDVEDNPMIGVTQDSVEQAYRAWAESGGVEPWIMLALWKKEGIGQNVPGTIAAGTADNAKSLYRSRVYFTQMGLDHFMHTTAAAGDNQTNFADSTAPLHEADFHTAVAAQVSARRLPRDISGEINAELTATPAGAGRFTVTASSRFYTLSLMLADAYYRENAAAVAADPRIGANPDPGLVYVRWNMGGTRFNSFVGSAEGHRMEPQYNMPGGRHPSIAQWAFERAPRTDEYGQARSNAIRFRYFAEVFRLIYEGW